MKNVLHTPIKSMFNLLSQPDWQMASPAYLMMTVRLSVHCSKCHTSRIPWLQIVAVKNLSAKQYWSKKGKGRGAHRISASGTSQPRFG